MRSRILGGLFVLVLLLVLLGTVLLPRRQPGNAVDPLPVAGPPPVVPGPAQRPLPPSQQELWSRPVPEPAFAQFADWTRRYTGATPQAVATIEADGVALARARLTAMAELIQSNPQRALELAVPQSVRDRMPDAVKALLEQPVNATGDLEVLAFRPVPGSQEGLTPVLRFAVIDGQRHQAFTFGKGLRFITKTGVPLNGIRVPAAASPRPPAANGLEPAPFLLALSESPARVLDAAELAYWRQARRHARQPEPVCSVSGQPWTINAEETAVQLAGDIRTFCGQAHAADWVARAIAASGLEGGAFFQPASEGTAASSYTEGRKRMLTLRPYWSDQPVALSTNSALVHFANFSNYMFQLSYGKLVFAPLRQGSDISPEILMPGSVTSYSAGLGSTFTAIKNVARTNYGMDSADYDFVYYVTGSRPAASYAGLGSVGGVGFHLANGYFDAATSGHEFGHNLGLNHANFWQTAPRTLIGAGSSVEYGDGDDPMGGGGNPNQYNSRYKNYLGWIPDSDVANLNALGSGKYRLYCFDLDTSSGLRGLTFARNGSQNYWVQFRQRKSGTALPNGVQLLWTGNGNESSLLLDARLTGGSADNALVIGRTFSDSSVGLHVTPVGKGHTFPESIEVVVNTGSFPANQPPACVVSASSTNVGVGQSVTFSARAADANGDPLAYHWTFDDDSFSVENSATIPHAFPAAGEYTVQCVVSDMKGGVGRDSVVVRVGSPSTFRISGRVFTGQNRPLTGIQVSADATHFAYTDGDGAYTITALAAGSYTLSALEPVTGTTLFIHPFFSNPVTVGPNAANRDFIVGTPVPPLTILAAGSTWKYLDNGSDQGTAWIATNFNDTAWASGPAQLGYGEGDEATIISFGPNASAKYTTTYFRRAFTVANPALYTNLSVNVLRDDGVIVFLNGVEVFRSNMPGGPVGYTNFASASVDSQSFFPVNASLLRAGTNVFAVELHQGAPDTSDASFDLSLTAESATNVVQAYSVYLTGPDNGAVFTTPANVTLTANALITVGAFTNVEFFDGAIKLGEDPTAPYSFLLSNPSTSGHILSAVATTSGGIRRTSPPVAITVAQPVTLPVSLALVPAGSTWRYMATNVAQPASWPTLGFNDSAWPSGPAELGFGDGGEATTINGGPSANRYPAVYFRRAFSVNDPGAITNLALHLKRDDGAVVQLNGLELLRDNMPAGAIGYSTLASAGASDDGAIFYSFNLNPALLQPGTNLLAVEVHQSAPDSSDLSFDLSLTALASTNRSRGCWLVAPAEGATIPLPGSLTLSAQAVVGGTLGLARIEYYSDGALIGAATVPPFTLAWPNVPSGARALTAVAIDSASGSVASGPVNVTILPPPAGTALISFGDIWNYMDEGVDLGTAWTAPGYNDHGWPSGPARLGYGGDGELTTVSFGANANARHITTYFRKTFSVANSAAFSGLFLQLARDDGAAVYLNGVEIYRNNLQDGLVSWNSLATATVDGALETTPVELLLGTAGLVAGRNTLAVEIHQASANSSDLGFDLSLTGLAATNTANGMYLANPANGTHYNSPAKVGFSAFAAAPSPVTLVEYFAGSTKVGQSLTSPFNVTWTNPPVGAHTLTARATYGAGWMLTSPPVSITVGYPPPPTAPVFTTFIPAGAAWNYWDNSTAVAAGWQGTAFNGTTWPVAPARFGFGLDGEATLLTEGRVSFYFRRWFNVANPFVLSELNFLLQRDDGAVVYLNGVELYRSNMPAGAITAGTLASTTVNTPDETTFFETVVPVAGLNLITGSNLVAVELHQATVTSSDAGFNLQLIGMGTTGPRVYFTSPVDGSSFLSTATVAFDGTAYAGTGQSVAKVELFADGVKLGETNSLPFHFTWVMSGVGPHTMLARMTDGRGYTVDSSPLSIHVVRQAISTTLIPSNSVWKYLSTNVSQGTAWIARTYNDTSWPSGPARLGAGGDGEVTLINIGPTGARYPTIYFRKSFVVPPGAIYTNLLFKLARDDGAVVYLNGREAYRDNMPAGAITYTTPAASSAADEQTFFPTNIAVSDLQAGANVVAVEVHQINATSTDLGFNLELTASGYLDDTSRPLISIELADGLIELSWPATYTSWRVYSSPELLLPIDQWTPVAVTPVIAGGRIVVSLPPSGLTQFFRLGRP